MHKMCTKITILEALVNKANLSQIDFYYLLSTRCCFNEIERTIFWSILWEMLDGYKQKSKSLFSDHENKQVCILHEKNTQFNKSKKI